MNGGYESIYLDETQCVGCTTCMQRCPTQAIRVRDGKAVIIRDRCVVCGECIHVCPHHAMKAKVDSLDEVLGQHKYTIALPAPSLYGQFPGIHTRAPILEGLCRIGFDQVFEVAEAAEAMSAVIHRELRSGSIPHPIITTACPVILRVVRIRFPSLLPHLLNYRSPMEIAARWSKRLAAEKTGLALEDIGCVFISPCPAKCASAKAPLGTLKAALTGIVSIAEVAPRLSAVIGDLDDHEREAHSGPMGIGWAMSGGQSTAVMEPNHLAASGMENIIRILEALENGKLSNVDLVELNACYPGCVGGALTVENPFIAKARILRLMRHIGPVLPSGGCPTDDMRWEKKPEASHALRLDPDLSRAMEMMEEIRELTGTLRGMDCGACGSPTCRAFAEDVVSGRTELKNCVFLSRAPEGDAPSGKKG